jgi:hypothetical protein
MALLCAGPGILCALTSVFVSLVYVRNRHLLECIMQDKVGVVPFHFPPYHSSSFVRQGVTDLPFNLWTFLSLPSLYFAWSLLLLGFVLLFCLFTPGHQLSWSFAILDIPVPILSTGLSLLVTLIPCSLVARNFQVLSRAIQPATTPKSSEPLKPMDLSSPSVLESTELVTLEKVLGLIPTAAHVILGYALSFCRIERHRTQICPASFSLALLAIGDFYNDPITRISLIIAIMAGSFAVILHLQASLRLAVCRLLPSQSDVT